MIITKLQLLQVTSKDFPSIFKPQTQISKLESLKEIIRSFGLNPEEILVKEALIKPHRTLIRAGIENSQVETLMKALKQKLKEELTSTPQKTVEITV